MAQREAGEPIATDGVAPEAEALVHGEHEPRLFERVVERVVGAVAEVAPVEMVGPRHHRDETQVGGPTRLARGAVGIRERRDSGGREPRLVVRAVLGCPVVVTAAGVGRLGCVELGLVRNEQPDRRVEHDGVDPLRVHRAHVGGRVEPVLPLVGKIGAAARDERSGRR